MEKIVDYLRANPVLMLVAIGGIVLLIVASAILSASTPEPAIAQVTATLTGEPTKRATVTPQPTVDRIAAATEPANTMKAAITATATPTSIVYPTSVPMSMSIKSYHEPIYQFSELLGANAFASDFLTMFKLTGRQPDITGFITAYYMPGSMNAFRTVYDPSQCIVAIDGSYTRDKTKTQHFIVVEVDRPANPVPFIAYVGDTGLMNSVDLGWDVKTGRAIEVEKGYGEHVAIDMPIACFDRFINSNRETAHGNVYILTAEETRLYLEQFFGQYLP